MKVLLFGLVWPEPTSSAAGVRTVSLLRVLSTIANEVIVWSPCQNNDFKLALEAEGFKTKKINPNDSVIEEDLKNLMPDLVIFDRFVMEEMFGWRVKECCPSSLLVLDTIDLHFLRKNREKIYKDNKEEVLQNFDYVKELEFKKFFTDETYREIASILRCDLTLLVSKYEYELLIKNFSIIADKLIYYPLTVKIDSSIIRFEEKSGFCTIGNFNHSPNKESVLLLRDIFWPKIREELISKHFISYPRLDIYGSYSTDNINSLNSPEIGFNICGWASESILTLQKYRVNLAPLMFGAGIKGKILDSWSAGTPVITTPIGAEGMTANGKFGGIISSSCEEFINHAISLYTNKNLFDESIKSASEIIELKFSPIVCNNMFISSIKRALTDIISFREKCFLSKMLNYHQFRSTEFMARWIEEKAKNKR